MEYAFDVVTGDLESAGQARGARRYTCPVCAAPVNLRAGDLRQAHFAHWPGYGSPACERFVPGQPDNHLQCLYPYGEAGGAVANRRKMELRLWVPRAPERAAWQLELILPTCRECSAVLTLDVGARLQQVSMRGMGTPRRVGADPSVVPYRIVSFEGKPDPAFLNGVESECPGLPATGAAAFSASGSGALRGFPRAQTLRYGQTFALLWQAPADPDFPDELVIERLGSQKGWRLALATLADEPSESCVAWLHTFTGLPMAPPMQSTLPVWPFFTSQGSINAIDCVQAEVVVVVALGMSAAASAKGPAMQAQIGKTKYTAVGVEKSPAFFALHPEGADFVRVADVSDADSEAFLDFSLQVARPTSVPAVELAFRTAEGDRRIVALHAPGSARIAAEFRRGGRVPEYLSLPAGSRGELRVDAAGRSRTYALGLGGEAAPHAPHMRLADAQTLALLVDAWGNAASGLDIDCQGFGRLRLGGFEAIAQATAPCELTAALRTSLRCFLSQLQAPTRVVGDDLGLVRAFAAARPRPGLVPQHRSLVKALLARGFELERLQEGAMI